MKSSFRKKSSVIRGSETTPESRSWTSQDDNRNSGHYLKIGEAAKALGVSIDTLRRWEAAGKIKPLRTPGGTRVYSLDLLKQINPALAASQDTEELLKKSSIQSSSDQIDQIIAKSKLDLEEQDQVKNLDNTHIRHAYLSIPLLIVAISTVLTGGIFASYLFFPDQTKQFFSSSEKPLQGTVTTLLTPFHKLAQAGIRKLLPDQAQYLGDVNVLAASTLAKEGRFLEVNADTVITGNLAVNGEAIFGENITAPNVVYGLVAGDNITISKGQTPTIAATMPGLLKTFPSSAKSGQFLVANSSGTPAFVTMSGDTTLSSTGAVTISSDAVALGSDTTGDYVKSISGGAGLTGSGSGEGSTPTLAVGAGNGITVNADDITIDATTTGTTTTTSANSGLETDSSGLSILRGCSNNQVLAWNSSTPAWACNSVVGVGGVTGSGTAGTLAKFTTSTNVGNSLISESGTTINLSTAATLTASSLTTLNCSNCINFDDISDSPTLDANLSLSQTTFTWSQTFTGTTTTASTLTANSLTTGTVASLSSTSTAGGASGNSFVLDISRSGANTNSSHTAYGLRSQVTNTGTTSTNIAGYLSASGATNNYALIIPSSGGNVGIGTSTPSTSLHVLGGTGLRVSDGLGRDLNITYGGAIDSVAPNIENTSGNSLLIGGTQNTSIEFYGSNVKYVTFSDSQTPISIDATRVTTGAGIDLAMGTALTTGSALQATGASYAPAAGAQGNLVSLGITDTASNTTGNSIVTGINLASTINTSGATGTKEFKPINIAAPTITACTGGNCTWSGVGVNTLTSGALSTLTSNGILITATGLTAGTLVGVNISNITGGAGTETALKIGSGWDNNLYLNDTTTRIKLANTGSIVFEDDANGEGSAGNSLCTITDAGTTGTFTCTGATVGYWSRSGTTLSPATSNDIVSIPTTNTTGADLAITNTGVYTGTGIVNLTANSATTGTIFSLSANGLTTGTQLSNTSTSNAYTTGKLLNVDLTQSAATGTSVSGNISSVNFAPTYSTAITTPAISGNVLNIARTATTNSSFVSTLTVSGALASFSDSATQTTGTLTSTADVVRIAQNYTSNSGAALNVTSAGGSTGFALRVNDDGTFTDTTPFVVDNSGQVGIGTTSPQQKLHVQGDVHFAGQAGFLGCFGSVASSCNIYIGSNIKDVSGTPTQVDTAQPSWVNRIGGGTNDDLTIFRIAPGGTWPVTGLLTITSAGILNCTDCIDFDDIVDTATLDASFSVAQATNTWTNTYTGTTGNAFSITDSAASQTTTTLLNIASSGYTIGYTGNIVNISGTGTTGAGNVVNIANNAIDGTGTALNVNSTTTGALTNGLVYFNASAAHTGNVVGINSASTTGTGLSITDSATMTGAGNLLTLTANSATTATGLVTVNSTGLTTGFNHALVMGTALTTGGALNITGASYAPAGGSTGNLVNLSFTDAASNTTGASTVNGINIASTVNTSGATGTKKIDPINIAAPTITACTGGNCTWSGVEVNTLTSGALATLTSNGVLVTATGVGAGTLNGVNISGITGGAGTETGIAIGSGWDDAINVNSGQFIAETTGVISVGLDNTATTNGLCHSGANVDVATDTTRDVVACSAAPNDIAEWNETTGGTEAGDLLAISSETFTYQETQSNPFTGEILPDKIARNVAKLEKTSGQYQSNIIGIVSTSPYQVFGADIRDQGANPKPVALSGRVAVKVSTENGPIKAGDYLTSSSTPGVAMKATHPGQMVGKALEAFPANTSEVGSDSSEVKSGKIMAFVNISYADPNNALANLMLDDKGNLIVSKVSTTSLDLGAINQYIDQKVLGDTQQLAADNVYVKQNAVELASKVQTIDDKLISLQSSVAAQSANLADVSNKVSSQQSALDSLRAQISEKLRTTQNASESGNLTNQNSDTQSHSDSLNLTPPDILLATGSATLADLKVTNTLSSNTLLTALDVTISGVFKALGNSFLGNTTIAGDLVVDGTFSVTEGSKINSLGCHPELVSRSSDEALKQVQGDKCGVLYIQTNPLATLVNFFNGKVTIDKDGTLKANTLIADQIKVTTGGSAGKGTIKAGQTDVIVENNLVKQDSVILITPNTPLPQAMAVANKVNGGFLVKLSHPEAADVSFDYLIIGQEQKISQSQSGGSL